MISEFNRCGAGTTLGPIDRNEVEQQSRLHHRLDQRDELPGMADAQFHTDRLATGQAAQLSCKLQ